ncbi:MAG: T9SS type A sorting domain-containing protein [Flavobacteriales bacterium]
MKRLRKLIFIAGALFSIHASAQEHSVAREWNELNLFAIRNDFARPTITARNLWHVSAGMYDAWAAYDLISQPYFLGNTLGGNFIPFNGVVIPGTAEEIQSAREEAVSYAAYRILSHRYGNLPSTNEIAVLDALDAYMNELGYATDVSSIDYENNGPAALGNYIAAEIIAFGLLDGSFEEDGYNNQYYESIHDGEDYDLVTSFPGNPDMLDPNRWQPLTLLVAIDQLGNPLPINTPDFLSAEWGNVVPFSLTEDDTSIFARDENVYQVYCDPGAPAYMDNEGFENGITDDYKWNHAMVAVWSSLLDQDNGIMIDASPNGIGNVGEYPETNSIEDLSQFYNYFEGLDGSQGHDTNPSTGMPYDSQMVPLGDYGRVLAEFWADGPDSETPPGHWYTVLNYVSDHPELEKKWNGQGAELDALQWDVKTYFALGGAMHDCAIAAWSIKGWYDYTRPISAIRYMGDHGQSSNSSSPSYDPEGLPLIPGYIELVNEDDPLVGISQEHLHKIKVLSWKGPDYLDQLSNSGSIIDGVQDSTLAGVGWILSENWWPYQRPTFVSPPFAGYVSGHSTFSKAAADLLGLMTGDDYFPGGMGVFPCPQNDFLVFETGPSVEMELQWATYKDASDQCSLSRIFGGIHPPVDDIPGRKIGTKIGQSVYTMVTDLANPLEPRVILSTTNTELINDAYAGTDLTIEVHYNLPMNPEIEPVLTFTEDLSGTLTLASGVWTSFNSYMWSFSTFDDNFTALDIQALIFGAQDLQGDIQQEFILGDAFVIDTENPSVSEANFTDNINEFLVGTNINLLTNFSEAMSQISPSVSFVNEDPTMSSLSFLMVQPEWINDSQFGMAYLINDADEELYNMIVSISGATDLAGNMLVTEDVVIETYIDTKAPTISNITYSTSIINESSAIIEGYSITVQVDDELLTSGEYPVMSFPLENPSSALIINNGASGFVALNEFEFVFDVVDTDLELSNIDVLVSEIRDAAGNIGEDYSLVDAFSIDTKAPTVLSGTLSTTIINEAETGNTLNITALFDEAMDETVVGEVVFNPVTPASLSSSSNSAWINTQLYRAAFDIFDENEDEELMIRLESAKDLAGNVMNPWDSDEALILDNKNPGGFITANTYNVTNDNIGSSGFQVLVLFDEEVNSDVIPTLNFPVEDPSGNITVNAENTGWFGSAYRFDFDVSSDLTPLAYIDIDVFNAEDLYGNSMSEMNLVNYFSIQLDTFLVVNELVFQELRVYPNPVFKGENFTIELRDVENYAFFLYDQLGRIIESEKMSVTGDKLLVSTAGLSSGKYFVKMKGENAETVIRLEVLN